MSLVYASKSLITVMTAIHSTISNRNVEITSLPEFADAIEHEQSWKPVIRDMKE